MTDHNKNIEDKKANLREALSAYAQFYSICNSDGSVGPDEVKKLKELQERIKVCEQELKITIEEMTKNDSADPEDPDI